jgi:hypothetical protein
MNTVTRESIIAKIIDQEYTLLKDGRTTICNLTLQNGFTVIGTSSCVDAANYDEALGDSYAFEDAIDKIWQLEGYLLKEQLFQMTYKFDFS